MYPQAFASVLHVYLSTPVFLLRTLTQRQPTAPWNNHPLPALDQHCVLQGNPRIQQSYGPARPLRRLKDGQAISRIVDIDELAVARNRWPEAIEVERLVTAPKVSALEALVLNGLPLLHFDGFPLTNT